MWQMTGEDNRTQVEHIPLFSFLSFHFFHSFPHALSSHLGPSHHRCKQQNKMRHPSFREVILKQYQLHFVLWNRCIVCFYDLRCDSV